uniref:Cytochrome b-c1 complex subunit 7 n=1 Tax=Strigamia maritima TaxID=126957 RepID=T1IR53_STRMM
MAFNMVQECANDLAKLESSLMIGVDNSSNFIADLTRIVSPERMDTIKEKAEVIQDMVKDYINMNEEVNLYVEAVKEMRKEINNAQDRHTLTDDFDTIFQEKLHAIKRNRQNFNPETHDKYRELLLNIEALESSENGLDELLAPAAGDVDGELLMCQENVNTLDPITKKQMSDPVRCKLCTHVYDKSSILDLIKQKNGRIRLLYSRVNESLVFKVFHRKMAAKVAATAANIVRNGSAYKRWVFKLGGWNQLGLLRDDMLNYDMEEVAEAIRRLPQDIADERNFRIVRAAQLSLSHTLLPEDQWHTFEQDVHYLMPYVIQVRKELEEKREWNKRP